MLYAQPGATFEVSNDDFASGLVGTIGVRILKSDGTQQLARSTSGIVEAPAGSGVYIATISAPTTAGSYVVVWDTGGALTASNTASDDLTVTYTLPAPATPSGTDLTTLDAVREFLQKQGSQTYQDPIVQSLIARASRIIPVHCSREFADMGTATRKFAYTGGGYLSLAPFDLRGDPTTVTMDTDTTSSTVLDASVGDYSLRPKPSRDGTYYAVLFPSQSVAPHREREVSIAGSWGFASVPADVEHACVVTVVHWLKNGVQAFSSGLNQATDRFEVAKVLPDGALAALAPYVRV